LPNNLQYYLYDTLKGGPIGRNSIVKNSKNFSERKAKISSKNSLPLPRNR